MRRANLTADVIIVTWRNRDVLARCLECLAGQTVEHRTIVVDNASGDGTPEMVRTRFAGVRVLELPQNIGFGPAVNAGVREGEGEAIVLVNDDVEVEPAFVEALVAELDSEHVGMVAGLTMMPGTPLVDGFGIELDVTLAAYNRLRRRRASERPGRLAGPSGGAAAYRRAAFEQAGGFDEALFAYGEDVDLALRMQTAGWEAAAAFTARGEHLGGATVGVDSRRQRELAGFARGWLLRRYGVLRTPAAARALLFEALVCGWGMVAHFTTVPLVARVRGWRAAGGMRRPIPPGAVDAAITPAEAFRRLRSYR